MDFVQVLLDVRERIYMLADKYGIDQSLVLQSFVRDILSEIAKYEDEQVGRVLNEILSEDDSGMELREKK